jgi:hypothetical protein
MNNSLVLSTFIKQLEECLEDIQSTYNGDSDPRFIKCKLFFNTIKIANPRLLITTWKEKITDKYRDKIEKGDIQYFIEKDYKEDAAEHYDNTVDTAIQDLRTMIRQMSTENINMSLKYIKNLCKLSDLYNV